MPYFEMSYFPALKISKFVDGIHIQLVSAEGLLEAVLSGYLSEIGGGLWGAHSMQYRRPERHQIADL